MGTRGLYGLRRGGVDKCTYNHYDSYPTGLGREMLELCAKNSIKKLNDLFNLIVLIDDSKSPTEEEIETFTACGYTNLSVGEQSVEDWYCLLRNLQGDIDALQNAVNRNEYIPMVDDIGFIKNSLFCEYAYIINLDDNVFEYYEGFQEQPQRGNRYGMQQNKEGYFPCKLCNIIPLNEITEDSLDRCISILKNKEDVYNEKLKWYNLSNQN